jgi:CheY-like chemotaxis protein
VARAGHRASSLTRQLLAFSRKENISPTPLDLNRLVPEMEKMLHRLIRENISWQWKPAADLGLVLADAGQMEQVIMNLVINACDAMPRGGTLRIETANTDDSGPMVSLSVSDTGLGMDQATRERLFEPFFTTKEAGRGTGLGLATAYGIVQQAGGLIHVESEPGRGSCFKVLLPRLGSQGAAAGPEPRGEAAAGGGETVLVVEDDELVRRLTRGVLGSSGYKVIEAAGAEEALALFSALPSPPDMMVTDLVMPGMGGQELSRRLHELQPELKVLFLSGYPLAAVKAQGLLKPGQDFLEKPYTPAGLASKVREVLDRKAAPPKGEAGRE